MLSTSTGVYYVIALSLTMPSYLMITHPSTVPYIIRLMRRLSLTVMAYNVSDILSQDFSMLKTDLEIMASCLQCPHTLNFDRIQWVLVAHS